MEYILLGVGLWQFNLFHFI